MRPTPEASPAEATASRRARPAADEKRERQHARDRVEREVRRGRRLVDRALAYAGRVADGRSVGQIARRTGKSKAHVSVLARLGAILGTMPEPELVVLRSPKVARRLTWRWVRERIRDGVEPRDVQLALRALIVEAPRPRRRRGADGVAQEDPSAFGWTWDEARAARDPAAYLAEYREHLAQLHYAVDARFRTLLNRRALASTAARAMASTSLRMLNTAVRQGGAGAGLAEQDRRALAELDELRRVMRAVVQMGGGESGDRAGVADPERRP